MEFSEMLVALKQGKKGTRANWNAAGQFVFLQKGYPDGIGLNKNTAEATGFAEGTVFRFQPYLMLLNAQYEFVPWVPSTGDIFAEDWEVV